MKQQRMCSHMMPSNLDTETQICITGSIALPIGNGHSAVTQREYKSELFRHLTETVRLYIKNSARVFD